MFIIDRFLAVTH